MAKEFRITDDHEGRRVDRFLRSRFPEVPLGAIMKALRTGEVRLDAKRALPDTRLKCGQLLQTPWEDVAAAAVFGQERLPVRLPLGTIYKDDYAWIVNKPAGLLTQPDVKGGDSLITRALCQLNWSRNDFRPATVQRLDRNTSGVVVIAMNGKSQRYLSQLIRERKIRKTYWAIVEGEVPKSGGIDLPLLKCPEKNIVVVSKKGQKALTLYKQIKRYERASLVELELITGRPHQARVHMAAIGCPILGDVKYGGLAKKAERQLLHARSVEFPDDPALPCGISGRIFTAALPEDMEKFLKLNFPDC